MPTAEIDVTCTVSVEVASNAPTDWLSRVTVPGEFPYTNWNGQPFTERDGLHMLAYNAVANGVEDASRLDGWGDLDRGMVTMTVRDVESSSTRPIQSGRGRDAARGGVS